MSFKNMDKLIYPAGYFRLRYSLNCVETHRGVFTVLNLTSGKEGFFFLCGLIKSFFPPTLSVRRHFDVPYCAFMLLYLASWVCFSVFFRDSLLFPSPYSFSLSHLFVPGPSPVHFLMLSITFFPFHILFYSPLYSVMYTCSSLQTS